MQPSLPVAAAVEGPAPCGLEITTYEIRNPTGPNYRAVPTVTHVFWGDNFARCIEVAKSHLSTDFFFSSSFLDRMPWQGGAILLENREPAALGACENDPDVDPVRAYEMLRRQATNDPQAFVDRLLLQIRPTARGGARRPRPLGVSA